VTYLLVLAACVLLTLPLERGARVYRRTRRLVMTLLPVVLVFVTWDLLAVRAGHWSFDADQLLGPAIGGLPLEELLFFLVVPVCVLLTFETVRRWRER